MTPAQLRMLYCTPWVVLISLGLYITLQGWDTTEPRQCQDYDEVQQALQAEVMCKPYERYRAAGGGLSPGMETWCLQQRLIVKEYRLCTNNN